MRRVEQLQAAKVSGMSGKSIVFKDFPRQAGLDAQELPAEHRLNKGCEATRSTSIIKNMKKASASRCG